MAIIIEISPAELIDKITILELKLERISDSSKLKNIQTEYDVLTKVYEEEVPGNDRLLELSRTLKEINSRLWTIEDNVRKLERQQDFGSTFVALARSVYRVNDERATVKRLINQQTNSRLIEEKSYTAY